MMHLEAFDCVLFLLSQPQRVVEKPAKSSAEHVHIAHEIMVIILFARSILEFKVSFGRWLDMLLGLLICTLS